MGSVSPVHDPTAPPVPSIPPPASLISLLTGKLKPLGSLTITSGIVKSPRSGSIPVSNLGLLGDEHDLTFHGGIDKAIHQYNANHYPLWRKLYPDPEVSVRFQPGGFGENLVTEGWNEDNVCVGDVVRIGAPTTHSTVSKGSLYDTDDDAVLLEVSLPRQPCFKLNQRFGIKNFAGRTHALNRTGWYYRVLRPGHISAGMQISVIERPNPTWTIARLHQFVHREEGTPELMRELIGIGQLGKECKNVFVRRLGKMEGEQEEKMENWRSFRVVAKGWETRRVVRLELEAVEKGAGAKVKDIDPGSHARLKLPVSEGKELVRAYSVVGGTPDRFVLGVAREETSRGGSKYIHETMKVGDILEVGKITESVPLDETASNHVLIAGGIGITAFVAAVKRAHAINYNYKLHYAVRSSKDIAFKSTLDSYGDKVIIYDKSKGDRMNIVNILKDRVWNTHVYVCGPQRMIDDVVLTAKSIGMSSEEVHVEAFQAVTSGDPFTVNVVGRKRNINVAEEETLLEALRKAGMEVPSSCEVGNCATCKVRLCKGKVEHRGSGLQEDEKEHAMLSCVSRGIGHIEVEIET